MQARPGHFSGPTGRLLKEALQTNNLAARSQPARWAKDQPGSAGWPDVERLPCNSILPRSPDTHLPETQRDGDQCVVRPGMPGFATAPESFLRDWAQEPHPTLLISGCPARAGENCVAGGREGARRGSGAPRRICCLAKRGQFGGYLRICKPGHEKAEGGGGGRGRAGWKI